MANSNSLINEAQYSLRLIAMLFVQDFVENITIGGYSVVVERVWNPFSSVLIVPFLSYLLPPMVLGYAAVVVVIIDININSRPHWMVVGVGP